MSAKLAFIAIALLFTATASAAQDAHPARAGIGVVKPRVLDQARPVVRCPNVRWGDDFKNKPTDQILIHPVLRARSC